jgi:hypothetical protein
VYLLVTESEDCSYASLHVLHIVLSAFLVFASTVGDYNSFTGQHVVIIVHRCSRERLAITKKFRYQDGLEECTRRAVDVEQDLGSARLDRIKVTRYGLQPLAWLLRCG